MRCRIALLLFVAISARFGVAAAADTEILPPLKSSRINIPKLSGSISLADFQGMEPSPELRDKLAVVDDFVEVRPRDNVRPANKTVVYMGYDSKTLYVVFSCYADPKKVRARMTRRENILDDDYVGIALDTFHDKRRGYAFWSNPLGVQLDALWTDFTSNFDTTFDAVWDTDSRFTEQGFQVLMSIPFKSLRFPTTGSQDPSTWGMVMKRTTASTGETDYWPRVSDRFSGTLTQEGELAGLESISPGRNMQFTPHGSYRSFREIDTRNPLQPAITACHFCGQAGLDSKFIFHDSFVLDVTNNPDFSQVESDEPQNTVNQRYEVYFPEKRPFFLENSNYFETPINLVFTRRIADPKTGVRLTGKEGPWSIGLLAADDLSEGRSVPTSSPSWDKRATSGTARVLA